MPIRQKKVLIATHKATLNVKYGCKTVNFSIDEAKETIQNLQSAIEDAGKYSPSLYDLIVDLRVILKKVSFGKLAEVPPRRARVRKNKGRSLPKHRQKTKTIEETKTIEDRQNEEENRQNEEAMFFILSNFESFNKISSILYKIDETIQKLNANNQITNFYQEFQQNTIKEAQILNEYLDKSKLSEYKIEIPAQFDSMFDTFQLFSELNDTVEEFIEDLEEEESPEIIKLIEKYSLLI